MTLLNAFYWMKMCVVWSKSHLSVFLRVQMTITQIILLWFWSNNWNINQYGRVNWFIHITTLQWRHNGCNSVSNHQPHDCLLNHLFRRRSKKTSKLRVTGLCAGNSPGTGEFPAQMASNAENVSIWWRHHEVSVCYYHTKQCNFCMVVLKSNSFG